MLRSIGTKYDEKLLENLVKELGLLTAKPVICLFNTNSQDEQNLSAEENNKLNLDLKLEAELAELSPEEIKELELTPPKIDQLIGACYKLLDLITFYTITGGKETRAWTIKQGALAPQAGGVVHSDFCQKFIRAEVIFWQELIEAGSWTKAREQGLVKTEGKEYEIKDGDVIEFKI